MPRRRTSIVAPGILCLVAGGAVADPWDAPPGYYAGATSTEGVTLKQQLHEIIDDHIERSYGTAVPAMRLTDQDLDDPSKIRLIYFPWSVTNVWDPQFWWNREHTWPRSRGVGESGPDNADLHALRPCDPSVNSVRGNDPFGEFGGSWWDPNQYGAEDRGEMARTMFYMATRYEGDEFGTSDLELVNGTPSGNRMGDLASLLRWHYEEMPDNLERRRNHYVYSSDLMPNYYQGNRNPFVDRPEFVWAIWGGGSNDSRIVIAGEQHQRGATTRTIDAQPRIVGEPLPSWDVTLSKIGADPTTYQVTTTGDAAASMNELPRAFTAGNGSVAMTVSIVPNGPGDYTGVVTIDNTDITSSGFGRGADDGDDTMVLSASVLAASQPSLDASQPELSRTVDLGQTPRMSGVLDASQSIFNLDAGVSQSDLVLSSPTISADPGVSASVDTAAPIAPGDTRLASVAIDTAAPLGVVEAVVTVPAADDPSVLGAQSRGEIVLTVRTELVQATCPGDLDGDGAVAGGDLVALLSAFGASGPDAWPGDVTGDGEVTGADLIGFLSSFGTVCP